MALKKSEDEVQQELLIALGRIILNTVGDMSSLPEAERAHILPSQPALTPDEVVSCLRGAAAQCDRLSRTASDAGKHDLEEVGFGLAALASDLEKKNRIA